MKVLFLTTSYPRFRGDDTSVFLQYFINSLNSSDVEVDVVVPYDNGVGSDFNGFSQGRVIRFPYGILGEGSLAFGAGLLPTLRRYPLRVFQLPMLCYQMFRVGYRAATTANVIHAHWIVAAAVGALIARIRKIPLVVTIHGSEMMLLRLKLLARILKFVLSQADSIVTVSEGFKNTLAEHFPSLTKKLTFISFGSGHLLNCEPGEEDPHRLETLAEAELILSVGTLGPRKNQIALLSLLLNERLSRACLVFCGKTDDAKYVDELKKRAIQLGVADRVLILGAKSPNSVASLLRECTLFVSASTFEGRPIAVLEALAAGCLVLVSRIPAHEEIIDDGVNGHFFSDSLEPLGDKAAAVLSSSNSEQVKLNARSRANNYSWEECSRKYKTLYFEVISSAGVVP